jgi:hypothetical protein
MAPKPVFRLTSFLIVLIYALSFGLLPASAEAMATPDLPSFVHQVENGRASVIRGVYARDGFALPVLQQPRENPGYVSGAEDVVTEFALASRYGSIGLLAHNHLAGKYFSSLGLGSQIQLIYGDGQVENFLVTRILRYQAISPTSPYTSFVDLESGETLTVNQVFTRVYTGGRHLTFQTCIAQGGELSWGRLFIIAEPLPDYSDDGAAAQAR